MGFQTKKNQRKRVLTIAATIVIGISSLLFVFYAIEVETAKNQSFQTLTVLTDQIKRILDVNETRTEAFRESLKEEYINRAEAVSYILDNNPEMEADSTAIGEVAQLLSIDEICIFDENGIIIGSSVPEYVGFSMDSGEQIRYFLPMLTDKTLEMCQDVTPNTYYGKLMMYAGCWNEAGTRIVQVGIEPVRLIKELQEISIPEVVASLGLYDGVNTFVADKETGEILGSSLQLDEGATLSSLGIELRPQEDEAVQTGGVTLNGEPSYMAASTHQSHIIVCTQSLAVAHDGIIGALVLVFLYLSAAAWVIVLIMRRMTQALLDEQRNATEDSMTELSNRRAYDKAMEQFADTQVESHFVYVSLDLNGLKAVNDTLGHEMGDKLICGCSTCIRESFGHCGELFRIGGDEFAALIYEPVDQLEALFQGFDERQRKWSAENDLELSISWGYAAAREHPDATMAELAQIADAHMYEAKRKHYEKLGKTPRSTHADSRR